MVISDTRSTTSRMGYAKSHMELIPHVEFGTMIQEHKKLPNDSIQVIKDQWEMPEDVIPNTLSFGVSSEINRKKLQNIEHLVQKLTRLNSTHDEAHTDYIASLNENTKPDDRYISEILLASGILLTDLGRRCRRRLSSK
ncbi:protein longifolia 1 [Tanacetum coccineum]